jgi:hypothetical protein
MAHKKRAKHKRTGANPKEQHSTPRPNSDSLFPRLSNKSAQAISVQRKIDIDLWSKGEPYPLALAKELKLSKENRKFADNPTTKKIVSSKAQLRRKIATSPKLADDFNFFLDRMGWHPELLLQYLYWDSNIMHTFAQAVMRVEKQRKWPVDRKDLQKILQNVSLLTEQTERLSKTDFSPAHTVILLDEEDRRLNPAYEKHLLRAFRNLPEILRRFGGDLRRKLSHADFVWSREKKRLISEIQLARQTSLYERIRAKTGAYHSTRLHRLISVAREVQGLSYINSRAFVIWLNKLKKRHIERVESASSPIQ